jgi:SLOG family YspA-like protein
MRVLVCGGRAYKDRGKVSDVLDGLHCEHGALIIIEGGAVGADTFAGEWTCMQRTCRLITEPAEWVRYEGSVGSVRNAKMIADSRRSVAATCPMSWSKSWRMDCARRWRRRPGDRVGVRS